MSGKSAYADIEKAMNKWAQHPTDQKLEEDKKEQPDSPDEDTVKDLEGAGVEKNKTPEDERESPADVPEDASTNYDGDVETPPQPGDHPTNQELQDQPAKAAELSTQLEEVGNRLQKTAADLLTEVKGDEDKDGDENEDYPEEKEAEAEESGDKESETKEAEADETVNMVEAGYEAAAKTAGVLMQHQAAQNEEELAKYAQAGAMDASALADQLDAAVGPALAGAGPEAPGAPETPMESALEEEGTMMTLEEMQALAEALKSGKEPETPQEQKVYEFLKSLGVAPEKSEAPEEPEEPEKSEDSEKESPPSDVEAEEGAKAKMASAIQGMTQKQRNELVKLLVTTEEEGE